MGFIRPFSIPRLPIACGLILGSTVALHMGLLVLSLVDKSLFASVFNGLALVPKKMASGEVQGLITSIFVHDPTNIFHLFFNMLLLYSLGPFVERTLGPKTFLILYFISGLSGSLLYTLWAFLFSDPSIAVVGASGAVLGILTAFSLLFPDAQLSLWFVAPIRGRSLVWLALALDAVFYIMDQRIAIAAHVGGILGAFAYIRRPWRPSYLRRLRWKVLRVLKRP